jgi:hypothetical protein
MHFLDLPAGKVFLDEQIEAHERKGERDRFRLIIRVLCGECVHDVLMNKRWTAMRERVAAQLIICILL